MMMRHVIRRKPFSYYYLERSSTLQPLSTLSYLHKPFSSQSKGNARTRGKGASPHNRSNNQKQTKFNKKKRIQQSSFKSNRDINKISPIKSSNIKKRIQQSPLKSNKDKIPPFKSFFDEIDDLKRERDAAITTTSSVLSGSLNALKSNKVTISTQKQSSRKKTEPKTIFDVLNMSKNEDIQSKCDYDPQSFQLYEDIVNQLTSLKPFVSIKKEDVEPVLNWLMKGTRDVEYDFSTLRETIQEDIASLPLSKTKTSEFQKQIKSQQSKFKTHTQLTSSQISILTKFLEKTLQISARRPGGDEISQVVWDKIKESGVIPSNDAWDSLLFVAGTVSNTHNLLLSRGSGTGVQSFSTVLNILGNPNTTRDKDAGATPSSLSDQNRKNEESPGSTFAMEVSYFHDFVTEPTDKSVSIRVKHFCSIGKAKEAELLLDSFPSQHQNMSRYLPVLKIYCEQGNMTSALKLFKKMQEDESLTLDAENYVLVIASLAEHGFFCNDFKRLEATTFGYSHGPHLLDVLLQQMSTSISEISASSARRLHNALAWGFQGQPNLSQNLESVPTLAGVPVNNRQANPKELVASRVSIGETTGVCPRTHVTLRLEKLDESGKDQLRRSLYSLATERFQHFNPRRASSIPDFAADELKVFAEWLDTRQGKPFTSIVDGANVAYYMQNFENGSFNIHQIEFMVNALEKMNEHPLVIMPFKYTKPFFWVKNNAMRRKQIVSSDEQQILLRLKDKGQLYVPASGCLDDYYWMIASISDQFQSRKGADLDVPPNNEDGRWPGTRPMLVSNDYMRDHRNDGGLLKSILFKRWFSCYMVNYTFTAFVGDQSADKQASCNFAVADFFSREIQSSTSENGTVWHLPVQDWGLDERFCIRIPS